MPTIPGMSEDEETVYRILIDNGPLSIAEMQFLADHVPVDGMLVEGMVAHGLAVQIAPDRFQAGSPSVVLDRAVSQAEDALLGAKREVESLRERYRLRHGSFSMARTFEVLEGAEAVYARATQLMDTANKSIWSLARNIDVEELPPGGYTQIAEAVRSRGVDVRTIIEQRVAERPDIFDFLPVALPGGQVRVAPTVPTRMMLIDDDRVFVPLVANEVSRERGLVMTRGPIQPLLLTMYESMWRQATPLAVEKGRDHPIFRDLEESDARILSLLLAGVTDQAIGRQMGMSLRTVQRRIHSLMEGVGAATRMQLGYEAGRREWVTQTDRGKGQR